MTESTTKGFDPFKTAPAVKPEVPEVKPVETAIEQAPIVSTNPGQIAWPTDKWGYTSKLRKEFKVAAATVNGQEDKQVLLLNILDLMRGHLVARFDKDIAARAHNLQNAARYSADRAKRGLR